MAESDEALVDQIVDAAAPAFARPRELAAEIVDGIYFGLPMAVYREVPRLGATDLCNLNVSAGDFWAKSWLNPDRNGEDEDEDEEKKEKWAIIGEAYHCARLEPDQFELRFCRKPTKADYAEQAQQHGACWNGKQVEAALAKAGEPKKKATDAGVADQAARLRETGYKGVIWPLIEAEHEAERNGRTALDGKVWDEIARDMERLRSNPEIAPLLEAGFAEVSVFWTDANNIQRKARFDWLAYEHWVDFKTFDNTRRLRLEKAIANAVQYNRYYLTAASYLEASEAVRTGGLQIIGDATEEQRDLVARIRLKPEQQDCEFVFQQKKGVPNLLSQTFTFYAVPDAIENEWDTGASEEAKARGHEATRRPTKIYQKGKAEIDYAKRLFAHYSTVYQPGEPWAPLEARGRITDLMFNPNWLEGLYD